MKSIKSFNKFKLNEHKNIDFSEREKIFLYTKGLSDNIGKIIKGNIDTTNIEHKIIYRYHFSNENKINKTDIVNGNKEFKELMLKNVKYGEDCKHNILLEKGIKVIHIIEKNYPGLSWFSDNNNEDENGGETLLNALNIINDISTEIENILNNFSKIKNNLPFLEISGWNINPTNRLGYSLNFSTYIPPEMINKIINMKNIVNVINK